MSIERSGSAPASPTISAPSGYGCPMAPEGQGVTFIELFFDLVFVFSITQLVGLMHHGLDWKHAGQAVIVFWLVWWAWTQYTWALNAADTTHTKVELVVLLATGVTFFMAVTLPNAFGDGALWFGCAYVLVRSIGLGLYLWVTSGDAVHRRSVQSFALQSVLGLVAVLVGSFLGGIWQYGFWGLAIVLDIKAAIGAGSEEGWKLSIEHFVERHGLFTIIALGECLIVAAHGLHGTHFDAAHMGVAVLGVVTTCAFWWTYFPRTKPLLERQAEKQVGTARIEMVRDVFTLGHFPMMLGVVALAIALEHGLEHDPAHYSMPARMSLSAGLLLFVGGAGLAIWRASGHAPWGRFFWVALGIAGIMGSGASGAALAMGIAGAAAVMVALTEQTAECPNKRQSAAMSIGRED